MTICYFGDYDPTYSRNRVMTRGLMLNGARVIECNVRKKGIGKYFNLWKRHRSLPGAYDVLVVGYSDTRWMVLFARLISGKPVVWDAFYSLYDSWVFDRKLVSPNSLQAKYYWFQDWLACTLAQKIVLDTNEHISYFVKTFRVDKKKCTRVLVGTDDTVFSPHSLPLNSKKN